MCMGYYDEEWQNLPKKIPYDSLLNIIAVIIHIILPIPIYFYRKKEEKRDLEQQHGQIQHNPKYLNTKDKYFIQLIFNYFMIFILFTEYAGAYILNE